MNTSITPCPKNFNSLQASQLHSKLKKTKGTLQYAKSKCVVTMVVHPQAVKRPSVMSEASRKEEVFIALENRVEVGSSNFT